jgi:hypothetical protein
MMEIDFLGARRVGHPPAAHSLSEGEDGRAVLI